MHTKMFIKNVQKFGFVCTDSAEEDTHSNIESLLLILAVSNIRVCPVYK